MRKLITILLVCISTLGIGQVDLVRLSDMKILRSEENVSLQVISNYTIAMVEDSLITIKYKVLELDQGTLICSSSYTTGTYRVQPYLYGSVALYINSNSEENINTILVFYNLGIYEEIKALITLMQ